MRVLILGDVMGRPARRAVRDLVPSLIDKEEIDLVVANAGIELVGERCA